MPVYDYKCAEHGPFRELVRMADSAKPSHCPECRVLSARIILSAPGLSRLSAQKRQAHEINEQNQHAPALSTRARREQAHEHPAGRGKGPPGAGLMPMANGARRSALKRPWMLGH